MLVLYVVNYKALNNSFKNPLSYVVNFPVDYAYNLEIKRTELILGEHLYAENNKHKMFAYATQLKESSINKRHDFVKIALGIKPNYSIYYHKDILLERNAYAAVWINQDNYRMIKFKKRNMVTEDDLYEFKRFFNIQ